MRLKTALMLLFCISIGTAQEFTIRSEWHVYRNDSTQQVKLQFEQTDTLPGVGSWVSIYFDRIFPDSTQAARYADSSDAADQRKAYEVVRRKAINNAWKKIR